MKAYKVLYKNGKTKQTLIIGDEIMNNFITRSSKIGNKSVLHYFMGDNYIFDIDDIEILESSQDMAEIIRYYKDFGFTLRNYADKRDAKYRRMRGA